MKNRTDEQLKAMAEMAYLAGLMGAYDKIMAEIKRRIESGVYIL